MVSRIPPAARGSSDEGVGLSIFLAPSKAGVGNPKP